VIELLDEVAAHARHALDDLRELEAAIHPAILTTRGLSPAVEGLAGRASLPVSVGSRLPARLPEELEAHAYYLVAELLAEATQDQSATHVGISLGTLGAALTIEIAVDLGPGSQQADLRVGHDGVALRTRALGGTLVRTARRGRVVVRLELPIPSTSTGVPASGDEG
jgi:signal transduction histidine kinase